MRQSVECNFSEHKTQHIFSDLKHRPYTTCTEMTNTTSVNARTFQIQHKSYETIQTLDKPIRSHQNRRIESRKTSTRRPHGSCAFLKQPETIKNHPKKQNEKKKPPRVDISIRSKWTFQIRPFPGRNRGQRSQTCRESKFARDLWL